jgi:hypothetical protein
MILTFAVLLASVGSQMFPGQAGQQNIFCVLCCAQLTLPRRPAQHYHHTYWTERICMPLLYNSSEGGHVKRDNLLSKFMENHWVSHCLVYPNTPGPSSLLNPIHLQIRIQTLC